LLWLTGHWLWVQRPERNQTLYVGDDSVALALRQRIKREGTCLDLCAGPGLQALQCSLVARRVIAVEVNPIAAALACVNVEMNDRGNVVGVRCGDLLQPVAGMRFDNVVANPPLLPFPAAECYPFVGHGGDDGMRLTRRILQALPDALEAGGEAQIIAAMPSDGLLPTTVSELGALAASLELGILMTIIAHHPAARSTPFFEGLVATAAAMGGERDRLASALEASLRAQGASHLCTCYLHITRARRDLRIQDLSRDSSGSLWFR
jgi:hypothetical protein